MVFYDSNSINLLINKLDYERWFLNFISNFDDFKYSKGTFYFRNNNKNSKRTLSVHDSAFENVFKVIMEKICPLTFVACFKALDMIFEWILEENKRNIVITNVKNSSYDRINQIKSNASNLTLPPIMQNYNYLFQYALDLYDNLRLYRNEVVHDNKFSIVNSKLQITQNRTGQSQIEINEKEMSAFVRIVSDIIELLINDISSLNTEEEHVIQYSLDTISNLHHGGLFNQKEPVLFNVVVNVIENAGEFVLNLDFIREELKKVFSNTTILINLYVVGITNENITNVWHFPVDDVPSDPILNLDLNYDNYTISKNELVSNVDVDTVLSLI